jgi:hypothetical protein
MTTDKSESPKATRPAAQPRDDAHAWPDTEERSDAPSPPRRGFWERVATLLGVHPRSRV